MRHAKAKYQLNRFTSWRKATLISLARNLLLHQRIQTTTTKAKAVKPLIEKLISLAKLNTLSAKRQAYRIIGDHRIVSMLFKDIGERFSARTGGYVRVLSLKARRGDNAQLVILELTEIKKKEAPKKEKEVKPQIMPETKPKIVQDKPRESGKETHKTDVAVKEKPPITKKPTKNFLGGLRNIFKKERDSL